uniref:WD_REPEATS_REGION domain-containing protein n=1 Tax=Parastrongyloides trichosuri TaxID=131310 RepID=A0A0N5A796_PARTI
MKLADGTEINSQTAKEKRASMIADMARRHRTYVEENAEWDAKKKLFISLSFLLKNIVMSIFGNTSTGFGNKGLFNSSITTQAKPATGDVEVQNAPDDTCSSLKFNPYVPGSPTLLAAGGWDCTVRVWQVSDAGQSEAKLMQNIGAPVLNISWFDDGSKLFIAGADKQARVWDLASNQLAVVGTHDEPVSTCDWISSPAYSCLMTGSWDKTLKFWDMRQMPTQTSLATLQMNEKIYCTDLLFPMAVVGLGNRHIKVFNLEGQPNEVVDHESQLKYQTRSLAIFKNKQGTNPAGYAVGSVEGRVGIQYLEPSNPKDNFTFKCHRSSELTNGYQEIYPVNDVIFNHNYGTLCTVGGDGKYSFWDKDSRTKLKTSDAFPMPFTTADIHGSGSMVALALGYDWSKGHEGNKPDNCASKIFLHPIGDEMKSKKK